MATLLTPKEIAAKFDSDPRTVRKFLRATLPDAAPGKGSRWAVEAKEMRSLKAKFATWVAARAADAEDAPDAD